MQDIQDQISVSVVPYTQVSNYRNEHKSDMYFQNFLLHESLKGRDAYYRPQCSQSNIAAA
jgi:hypothetical protein